MQDPLFDVVADETGASRLRRITDPEKTDESYAQLVRNEALLDVVACLLSGSVRFDHAKLNFKPAGVGTAKILWHQDWAFYPQTNDDMLAVGVFIEDCAMENAPLYTIPGSHKGPVYDHHHNGYFVGGITDGGLSDELVDTATPLLAPAGSISIHHVRTLHASSENRGNGDRPLLLLNYVVADAFPVFHTYN